MSTTYKKLKYNNIDCYVECANRDGQGNIISDTYVKSADVQALKWSNVSDKPFDSLSSTDFTVDTSKVLSVNSSKFALASNLSTLSTNYNTYVNTTAPATYATKTDIANVAYTDEDEQIFTGSNKFEKTLLLFAGSNDANGFKITNTNSTFSIQYGLYNIQYFDGSNIYTYDLRRSQDGVIAFLSDIPSLTNYYTKDQTYSQEEVNNLISSLETGEFVVVDKLPTTGEEGVHYLVGTKPPYEMYIWENGAYISLGTTEIDLTGYMKTLTVSGSGVLTGLEHSDTTNILKATFTDLTYSDSVTSGFYVSSVSQASNGKITVTKASLPASTNQTVGVGTTTFGASAVVKFVASQSNSSLATLAVAGNATANTITYTLDTTGITTALAGKQATLTAGNGIAITDNVIASIITATDITIG